jgi:hypothetical protein
MSGPIFIVGAMGSGTTLLRLMLDSHENIAIPPETGFMRGYDALRFTPFKWSGRNWTGRLGWSEEELDEELHALYDRLFMRYAEQHGKRRWGEKTPLHTWHIADMARLFPDAQFVAMVRHPYGSISSNMTRFRSRLARASSQWTQPCRELAAQTARRPDRFVMLRYEDLVLEPEPLLRELLDWLGEPWSPSVLEHHAVQPQRGGRKVVEGRSRVDDPIDVSRIAKWKTVMPDEHQVWLSERVGALAAFFGYSLQDPAVLEPFAPGGSALLHGADMEARIRAAPALELHEGGLPSPYDQVYDPRKLMVLRREEFAWLTRPRGARRIAIFFLRRIPFRPGRKLVIRLVRRTRLALGLTRRPHLGFGRRKKR